MKSPSPHRFQESLIVPAEAVDENGHVNNVVYVQWMQDIAIRHFSSVVEAQEMEAVNATWFVRSHEVTYRAPAFGGNELIIQTWIADFRRIQSRREYRFLHRESARELVRGKTEWVYVDRTTGRPQPIPQWIQDRFRQD